MDYDGIFNVYAGLTSMNKVGQVAMWNYSSSVGNDIYEGWCGLVSGSAGDLFPPGLDKSYVDLFSPDLCR